MTATLSTHFYYDREMNKRNQEPAFECRFNNLGTQKQNAGNKNPRLDYTACWMKRPGTDDLILPDPTQPTSNASKCRIIKSCPEPILTKPQMF